MQNIFRIIIFIVCSITILSIPVVAQTTEASKQQQRSIEKRIEDLVNSGHITADQAAKILQGSPGGPPSPAPNYDFTPPAPQSVNTPVIQPEEPEQPQGMSYDEKIAHLHGHQPQTRMPTFMEVLGAAIDNPEGDLAHRKNYYNEYMRLSNDPKEMRRWNIFWNTYSPKQKMRVLEGLGVGNSIGVAAGTGHLNMIAGWMQEIWDTPDKWESFKRNPFGAFRKDFAQTSDKYGFLAPFIMGGKIIWGILAGTVTGVIDIAQGDARLESPFHLLFMEMLLSTGVYLCYCYRLRII